MKDGMYLELIKIMFKYENYMTRCMCNEKRKGFWSGKKLSEEHKRHISEGGKGRVFSNETRKKLSEMRMGENNPAWKGDDVTYGSLHDYIRWHKPKPDLCENCKGNHPRDLHNIPGTYKRNLEDWVWLCRSCHMIEDERLEKLIVHNKREYSEETRNKMSEALKGNKRWLGKHHTEETKRKISESQKKRLSH
jgi:hypothetical protein